MGGHGDRLGEAEANGVGRGRGPGCGAQFGKDARDVVACSLGANEERIRDLPVGATLDHKLQYFPLAGRQTGVVADDFDRRVSEGFLLSKDICKHFLWG